MKKSKINSQYLLRKDNVLLNKEIKMVSSVYFAGLEAEVQKMKAFLSESDLFWNEKSSNGIIEGSVFMQKDSSELSYEKLCILMKDNPNLKWTFFFLYEPLQEESEERGVILCTAFSESGIPHANRYWIFRKYSELNDCLWILKKSVITAEKEGYKFPFAMEWKKQSFIVDEGREKYQIVFNGRGGLVSAQDTMDMYHNYRRNMARYKSAINQKFYYEALLIDYGLLEDVTFEFLYYVGIFQDRINRKVNKKVKNILLQIINSTKKESDHLESLKVDMISLKLDIIRSLAVWTNTQSFCEQSDPYEKKLRHAMESIDIQYLVDTCDYINWWLDYRNEIMHAMMKKNIYSLDAEVRDIALEGMEYFNSLKKAKDVLKKGKIRDFLGLK